MSKTFLEESHFIAKEDLFEHAAISVLRNSALKLPGTIEWIRATVSKKPTEIYDLNGKLLFLDFAVKKDTRVFGTVRTSASAILGSPAIAHELGERYWNYDLAVKELTPKVKKGHPTKQILDTKLICYSYPKLGVMFEMVDEHGKKSRLIFDVADFSPIPEKPSKPDKEGAHAWSFYDSLSEDVRSLKLKQYGIFNKWRLEIPAKTRESLRISPSLVRFKDVIRWQINKIVTKQLQFCEHYSYNEARSHHCFILHAQQINDYCAVATAQMILCFYRYYYTQDQIAPALNYSSGGGCPSDQSAGYKQLSCNHLDASFDSSPTWEEARNQIDALHPLKSGITGHARACAGYSYERLLIPSLRGLAVTQKKLLIYDPWPWNSDYKLGGSVYWEDWDSITHTNYVFTRLLCP